MPFKHLLSTSFLLLLATVLAGQVMERRLTFNYRSTPLQSVLEDLENRYELQFAYSSSRLPMREPITARAEEERVNTAIEALFQNTPIHYAFISDRIALRFDPGKVAKLELPPPRPKQTSPIYEEKKRKPRIVPPPAQSIPIPKTESVSDGDERLDAELEDGDLDAIEASMQQYDELLAQEEYDDTHRLAQISLLPYLGTNREKSGLTENRLSFNIIWGTSKAVDGFEIGGVGNTVKEDMVGFQVAGVCNQVGGDVGGSQISGVVNHVEGRAVGAQIAGISNITKGEFIGAQVAGLFNYSGDRVAGVQVAGLFNHATGDARNQLSFLFNRARNVKGRQIGIFNISDSTAKAPIGVLSFVRKGYNKLELSSNEAMYANVGIKLGVHRFYNILHFGLRWDNAVVNIPEDMDSDYVYTWSLGYGLGLGMKLGKKSLLATELVISHVNEQETWTNTLNLHSQFRLTFDYNVNGIGSFFFGPTFNNMASQRRDTEGNLAGSILPYNTFDDQTLSDDIRFQWWFGFTAGIRL